MQKSVLVTIIGLMISSCHFGNNARKSKDSVDNKQLSNHQTRQHWSLNGYTETVALKMIANYIAKPIKYPEQVKLNIWFSTQYVDDLNSLLGSADERADGIRVYFARNDDAQQDYNFIITTAAENGDFPTSEFKKKHIDYYDHNAAFLTTNEVKGQLGNGTKPGTILYNTTPFCPNDNCTVSPEHDITCKIAHHFVQQSNPDTIITHGEWFGNNFIKELDEELNKQKVNGADGVRIYYAENDNNRRCFVFVVTVKQSDGSHKDYPFCFNTDLPKYFLSPPFDKGELCPNNCN